MKYIEAPNDYTGHDKSLFLAGGITGCADWQTELTDHLKEEDIVILNPRRANFPMNNPLAAKQQIEWEHKYLRQADAISFWFPKETLCPITLYELGSWSMTDKQLFIGVDIDYKRRQDMIIQTGLVRSDIQVVFGLDSLAEQIKQWTSRYKTSPDY